MLTVRIQEKNYSESIMVLKLKDGDGVTAFPYLRNFYEYYLLTQKIIRCSIITYKK